MKHDVPVKNGITIPEHEIEISTSRSGGPGGQHVNTTNTRITVRWNIPNSNALTHEQKERVLEKLQTRLTTEGDLVIHHSTGRSQLQNKELALKQLADTVRNALHVPKKRMATRVSKAVKEARQQAKTRHSAIKKMRKKQYDE
jgi:ribosome-associated protein